MGQEALKTTVDTQLQPEAVLAWANLMGFPQIEYEVFRLGSEYWLHYPDGSRRRATVDDAVECLLFSFGRSLERLWASVDRDTSTEWDNFVDRVKNQECTEPLKPSQALIDYQQLLVEINQGRVSVDPDLFKLMTIDGLIKLAATIVETTNKISKKQARQAKKTVKRLKQDIQ